MAEFRGSDRLTLTQFNWLLDVARGIDPWSKIHGRSAHGGACGTQGSLIARGFLDPKTLQVTPAGHKAIEKSEDANVGGKAHG